ncbi:MAG TPA: ArsR family transcriptional regulator [Rubrivivax sp.]|jgi:hypothetical protein|nr:ArsR family transcriptional regulator [Rubrivivax sp.]
MRFEEVETADRRLVLLRGLADAAQYRANAYLLRRYAEAIGHTASADRIETDITWLAEQGLVERAVNEGVTVATLTARGLDVSTGAATTPGVARPRPE